jgi:hypothetical protein
MVDCCHLADHAAYIDQDARQPRLAEGFAHPRDDGDGPGRTLEARDDGFDVARMAGHLHVKGLRGHGERELEFWIHGVIVR